MIYEFKITHTNTHTRIHTQAHTHTHVQYTHTRPGDQSKRVASQWPRIRCVLRGRWGERETGPRPTGADVNLI